MADRMPEGKYYVGDLCYVMSDKDWAEVCSLTFPYGEGPNRHKQVEGMFVLSSGATICIYGTAYGDGVYADQHGREYYVDSGTLGCVSTSVLDKALLKKSPKKGSHVLDMPVGFDASESDGRIQFGGVIIDTSCEDDS